MWGSGFLPTRYQGVKFRSVGDPVLYLSNPPGFDREKRRIYLDALRRLNQIKLEAFGDPEISTRIAQYEMAYRMQASVPELTDLVKRAGRRRLSCTATTRASREPSPPTACSRGGWPSAACGSSSSTTAAGTTTTICPRASRSSAKLTDQACAALVTDLKQRGLLDDTLVIWGGEFGRTVYCQGRLTADNYGRDHHPRCFAMWLAGGGIKPGKTIGETDEYSYNIVADPVHVHDLQATMLHALGIDHTRLTYKHQGRAFRLTDVAGEVVKKALA